MTQADPPLPPQPGFAAFFRALWSFDPVPWQAMLAARVATGGWPQALDLPTAAGKTACIDLAIWALAQQADRPTADRTAPRRVWFVVDRRIVVDEAFARASAIAEKLRTTSDGTLAAVAARLRAVSGTDWPLGVARLRGGVLRDDGQARLPSQPAVITSTVDQLGSRLLFRGYGWSHLTAPVFAGLAANDSLILLDEAHCSVPFLQTLRAIASYRGERWAKTPLASPFAAVVLSATPPADVPAASMFPGASRETALDHPVLRQRLDAEKPAELVEVAARRGDAADPLVAAATQRAQAFTLGGHRRVAVMVNRVRTAGDVAAAVRQRVGERADVVLLTGRMRPYERDRLVERWKPCLRASNPEDPARPVVVVSTQCLEVGADFSFDALVTEAASLDALRQRFGRLNRMGAAGPAPAAILVRAGDSDSDRAEPDPIYGKAIATTWKLLRDLAGASTPPTVDMGFEALRTRLADLDDLTLFLAPTSDAPVLLPAHLDLLCQTSPTPHPEPDVTLWLHGKDRGAPEVRVLWRADLAVDATSAWIETLALCPPSTGEMLAVPLHRLRSWLEKAAADDDLADVEGVAGSERSNGRPSDRGRTCLLWRGRDRSRVTARPYDVHPDDVVVLPAAYGIDGLGQSAPAEALGGEGLDLFEPAHERAGRPACVRLHRSVLHPWLGFTPLRELVALAEAPSFERADLDAAIDAVLAAPASPEAGAIVPEAWWLDLLRRVREGRARMEAHPGGGVLFAAHARQRPSRAAEPDLFADDDDLTSASAQAQDLDEHSELVRRTVEVQARRCLPADLVATLCDAAWWHDAGKLDERFQVLLHGDELAALAASAPLAKSDRVPTSPARRRAAREASRLPDGFRHEMLSVLIAQRHASLPDDPALADLLLHLVASHHGHARPFAPVSLDPEPPGVDGALGDARIQLSQAERAAWQAHRIDSGLAERFWRMTRRHGWWGLAYLEAIVRLGDWYASGLAVERRDIAEVEA